MAIGTAFSAQRGAWNICSFPKKTGDNTSRYEAFPIQPFREVLAPA
jgi:hypothetical protein